MLNALVISVVMIACSMSLVAMDQSPDCKVQRARATTFELRLKTPKEPHRRHTFARCNAELDTEGKFGHPETFSIESPRKALKQIASSAVAADAPGLTLLHRATLVGNTVLILELLKMGAEVNVRDCTGKTPLHVAAASGNPEIIDLLIANGADCSLVNNEGYRPVDMLLLDKESLRSHFVNKNTLL